MLRFLRFTKEEAMSGIVKKKTDSLPEAKWMSHLLMHGASQNLMERVIDMPNGRGHLLVLLRIQLYV